MINSNLPYQMSVNEAVHLMRESLMRRPLWARRHLANNFLAALREREIIPSKTFIQAFEMAVAPFKGE